MPKPSLFVMPTRPGTVAPCPAAAVAAVLVLLASAPAHAEGLRVGVGGGSDRGNTDCVALYECNRSSSFGKLFAAYDLGNGFGVQVLAFDAGRFKGGDTTPLGTPFGGDFKVGGVGVSGVYRWAFTPGWVLQGQLGVARVRTRFDYVAPFGAVPSVSESTTQPLAGIGLSYALGPNWQLSLDFDVTRFKVYTTRGSLQMLGVSAQYSF